MNFHFHFGRPHSQLRTNRGATKRAGKQMSALNIYMNPMIVSPKHSIVMFERIELYQMYFHQSYQSMRIIPPFPNVQ